MTKFALPTCAALLVLTVAVTFSASASASASATEELIIKIGHVAPLSGGAAHLGKDNENGARMAIEELNASQTLINGKRAKFVLVPEDDGGDPKQGAAVAQKLVDANVRAVIGHLNSGTSIPAAKIYSTAQIPQIAPSVTAIAYTAMGNKSTFRLVANDGRVGGTLGTYAVQNLHANTIAVIDDRTSFGQGLADQFIKAAKAANPQIKMAQRQFTNDKATDFSAILTAIKASKADVIFFGGMDSVAGPMLRQMKALGIDSKFMGGDGICSRKIAQLAGDAIKNDQVICAVAGGVMPSEKKGMDDFLGAYKNRYGTDIQTYSPYTYDAVMTIADAMKQAKSSEPAVYLPYLQKIQRQGITGKIAFDSKGDLKNAAMTLYTYQNGNRIPITVIK